MHIELNYTLTPDDLFELQGAYFKISKELSRPTPLTYLRKFLFWSIILAGAVLMFLFLRDDRAHAPLATPPDPPPSPWVNTVVSFLPYLMLVFVVWFFFLRQFFSKRPVRKLFKEDPSLAQPRTATLTDDGATFREPTSQTSTLWTHFVHFAETESLFILMISKQSAHVLPKRAFPSPAALDEFRAFAQAHIGNTPIGFPVEPPKSPPQSKIES